MLHFLDCMHSYHLLIGLLHIAYFFFLLSFCSPLFVCVYLVPSETPSSPMPGDRKSLNAAQQNGGSETGGGVWARLWYPPRLRQKIHRNYWGNCSQTDERKRVELVSVEKPAELMADGTLDKSAANGVKYSPKSGLRPKSAQINNGTSSAAASAAAAIKDTTSNTTSNGTSSTTTTAGATNTAQQPTIRSLQQRAHSFHVKDTSLKDHLKRISYRVTKTTHDV